MALTETKLFTPQEARRTLPLVKKIVKDILDYANQIKAISDSLGGQIEESEEVRSLTRDIEGFMKELEELGCFYKDWNFQIGLVDFPSLIGGREVLLCWRSDEEDIRYYHGLLEGYAGRKPIPGEYL